MKPKDVVEMIESMPNGDRLDTLDLLFETYFSLKPTPKELSVLQAYYEGGLTFTDDYEPREFY